MADGGTGRGGTTGRGDPEEGRGRADAVGGGEEKRTGKGREPCCRGVPYELRGPPPSTHGLGFLRQCLPRRPMRFGRDPTTDPFGGCFWAEFRELPPRFPAEFPPSAVCRRLRGKGPEAGPVAARCEKVVLCATVPSASFSSAPNLRRAERSPPPISPRLPRGWALALAWGRARGRTRRKEHVEHDQKGLG